MGGEVRKFSPGEGPPRVMVTLQVATERPGVTQGADNPNAAEFVRDTIQQWLKENGKSDAAGRALVPYDIHHVDWKLDRTETIAVVNTADPNAPELGSNQPEDADPRAPGRGTPRSPGRGRDVVDPRGVPGDFVVPTTGGTSGTGTNTNVDGLAPLPKAPALHKPGATVSYFIITWEAYLKPSGKEGGA